MSKSGITEDKDFRFFLEFFIAVFVGFFAIYPVMLDLFEERPNALIAAYYSFAYGFGMVVLILIIAYFFSKKWKK